MISISALYIYPVKSCRGIALSQARLDAFGFEHDRRFLVVDGTGHFLTQRSVPRMSLVETELTPTELVLRARGAGEFRVPLPGGVERERRTQVVIWRDTVEAIDLGDAVANWLRDCIGQRCRLVHTGANFGRTLRREKIPAPHQLALPQVPVAFVDAYPLLVVSEASVALLNERQEPRLLMDRFRPNVVIKGCAAHDEDHWPMVRINGVEIRAGGDCARCTVTTVDQATAVHGKEPLRALAKYRRTPEGSVIFGQNWIHAGPGTLQVGDRVEVGVGLGVGG